MCGYYNQELIAQKDTVARAHYGRAAQETYRVRRGERLHAIDGVVITNKPSILKVIKSCELTQGVSGRPGDLVYVLWYEGENFAKAWHRVGISTSREMDRKVAPRSYLLTSKQSGGSRLRMLRAKSAGLREINFMTRAVTRRMFPKQNG